VEAGTFCGFRDADQKRNDFACSKENDTVIIQIPTDKYKEIITET